MRGYCGIGVYKIKTTDNMGTLIRSAYFLGANLAFTIEHRYKKQPTGVETERHFPVLHFNSFEELKDSLQPDCQIVFVELSPKANSLEKFCHPERAIYILGAEDEGIPEELMKGYPVVQIPETRDRGSLNVAVAGSILLYDRLAKQLTKNQ